MVLRTRHVQYMGTWVTKSPRSRSSLYSMLVILLGCGRFVFHIGCLHYSDAKKLGDRHMLDLLCWYYWYDMEQVGGVFLHSNTSLDEAKAIPPIIRPTTTPVMITPSALRRNAKINSLDLTRLYLLCSSWVTAKTALITQVLDGACAKLALAIINTGKTIARNIQVLG
jgi:hypothetical protein